MSFAGQKNEASPYNAFSLSLAPVVASLLTLLPVSLPMHKIEDLSERVERLLLRHEELQRTSALLRQELLAVSQDRDSLKARLAAARSRIDALINKLPSPTKAASEGNGVEASRNGTD
jgi:membrane glycosyltransferase